MIKRCIALAGVVLIASCDFTELPSGPDGASIQPALVDGSTDTTRENVLFLTPLVKKNPKVPKDIAFGSALTPAVEIRCNNGAPCLLERWETGDLSMAPKNFQIDWITADYGVGVGDAFRIVLLLPDPVNGGEMDVAWADVEFAANGKGAKQINDGVMGFVAGEDIPIKFWLGENAIREAVQNACDDESGAGVVDCDVTTSDDPMDLVVDDDRGATTFDVGKTIFDPSTVGYDSACFEVLGAVPACEVEWTAVMEHVEDEPSGSPDPAFPFFVTINVFGPTGLPVRLVPGVVLFLCQDESALNGTSPFDTQLFQTSNGGFQIIDSANGTMGFCDGAGNAPIEVSRADSERSVLKRLAARVGGLARKVLGPAPLHAVAATHGGKRSTVSGGIQNFSGFGVTEPEGGSISGTTLSNVAGNPVFPSVMIELFACEGEGSVEGSIVSEIGFCDQPTEGPIATTESDSEDGSYSFTGLEPGFYELDPVDPNGGRWVREVEAGEDVTQDLMIFGVPPGVITGVLSSEDNGFDPDGIEVTLVFCTEVIEGECDPDEVDPLVTTADENGVYIFSGLAPGIYLVSPSSSGSFFPSPVEDDIVDLGPGEGAFGIDFEYVQDA